jgi:phosphatidylglycerophosphate synthase
MNSTFSKDTDGFMARHFDRRISGAISRLLLHTPITPNQITLGVTALGVWAGALMAGAGSVSKLEGSLLFLATSILDGCDGEVARAKKMTSRLGGWLDLWGDNVVHVAVFYGLGIGLQKDTGQILYRYLGFWAALGTLLSAAIASIQTYRKSHPREGSKTSLFQSVVGDVRQVHGPAWKTYLVKASDALARRDFIYVVVILALVHRLDWFLWATAIGANAYAVVLVFLWAVTES